MNKLTTAKRTAVVAALVEGNSVRGTVRLTGVAKKTVLRLLLELGDACSRYQDEHLRNLKCRRIQCDEIWQFCYAKAKNVPDDKKGQFGFGDVWTWVAMDADTKLIPSWSVATRDSLSASMFLQDLQSRIANRVQITTDGHHVYADAIEFAFGDAVDYAQLIKLYGNAREGAARYSPAKIIGTKREVIRGNPDPRYVSTSFVERQNLTMRMHMRRFTRLTNAFSKKVENMKAAVAIHFMYVNFARVHQTLRVTPAMEAGIANHVWSIEEIVGLLDRRSAIAA